MAGPFQPYDPDAQKRSSPGSGSPLSPSGDGNPVSFRKNVNRAKTKRWVEAKQYSYDGDDWGEDEYDEYDDSPPPVPQPPSLSKTNGGASGLSSRHSSRPSLLSADRSRSTDQVVAIDSDGSRDRSRSAETKARETSHGPQDSKPHPFVRPADIYRRMQESADQQDQSHDVGRPGQAAQEVGQSVPDPASKPHGHDGVADDDDRALHNPLDPATRANPGTEEKPKNSNGSSLKTGDAPAPALPEVKGLSNFGTDVLGKSTTTTDTSDTDSQRPPLQHNNSFGLQSAVHQAFDVPETPSSAVEGVSRSNSSDNTSVISPIIGNRPAADQKTPTIVEEPGEAGSTPGDTPGNVPFKPGHRRDLSLPSSDNSPSRKPEINESEPHPRSANAEMSSTEPPQDYFHLYRPTMDPSGSSRQSPSHGEDLPEPLRPTAAVPAEQHNSKDSLPVIVPSMSRDNSPEDTENDRLRKEIIRSLSRENSPSDEPEGSRPETGHGDNLNPNQQYRNGQAGHSPYEPPKHVNAHRQSSGPKTFDELLSEDTSSAPAPAAEEAPKPRLTRRFSWESSSSEELAPAGDKQPCPPQTTAFVAQPPLGSDGAPESVPNNPGNAKEGGALGDRLSTEKPKLSIIPPSTVDENSISDRHLPEVLDGQAVQNVPHSDDDGAAVQALVTVSSPPPSVEPNLLGFRDILGIKSSSERVRAFNDTRDQFAEIDTGLNHWIRATVNAHPEHMDTVEQSLELAGSAPKPSASRGKFPKLPSLGNLASSGPSGSLHVRRPSGHMMNRQQVEQRGKDLLHSAGVLGGRAGGAAKGFFAKGKSKFNRGGADKDLQSSPRSVHLPEGHSATEQGSAGSANQRRSIHLGSLPWVEPNTDSIRNPATKRKPVAEAHNRRRSTKSASDAMINDLGVLETKQRTASLASATRCQQPSPSSDAIADNSAREPPCADDFERELVVALGLDDVDSQPQQTAQHEFSGKGAPCTGSVDLGYREAIADFPSRDSMDNSRTNDEAKTGNSHHVGDQPQSSSTSDSRDTHGPAVKLNCRSDGRRSLAFPQSNAEAPQQLHESSSSKKAQLHENEGVNQLSPAWSLSHASNPTPSESLSHGSDGSLVVASKAIRAGHIRVVVNGLPKDSGGEPQSAVDAHENSRTGKKDPALSPREHSDASVSPNPSHSALGAESTGESKISGTPGSQSGDNDGSTHLSLPGQVESGAPSGQYVHQPSVSSLGGSEKSMRLSLQQPQLAQSDDSRISPPSEHADFTQLDSNRAADSSLQPDRDSPELGHDQSSHWRSEAYWTRNSDLVSPGQTVSGGFQKLSGMRESPIASRNNLTAVAVQNTRDQSSIGQYAMSRLKNIGGLRHISLGGVDGPRKNAMNRLSGLFTRPGSLQQNKSEMSPWFEAHGGRLCSSATENPGFANRFGEYDTPASGPPVEGRSPVKERFTPTIPPVTGHNRSSVPPQQGQPGAYRRPAARHVSMPSQSPVLYSPSKDQDPSRGRFYARCQSPKPLPPNPDESNPSNSSPDRPHYPGILPTQPETDNGQDDVKSTATPSDSAAITQNSGLTRKPVDISPPSITITENPEPQPLAPPDTGEEGGANHPHRGEGRTVNETQSPVELPVGNDDSSEEIVMTSTAYPGQEWRPAGFGFGGEWE